MKQMEFEVNLIDNYNTNINLYSQKYKSRVSKTVFFLG